MTDLQLGDDLIRQVELTNGKLPDGYSNQSVKFDAKGTLHVMCRNDDGKLLEDVPIKEFKVERSYKDEVKEDYNEQRDIIISKSKSKRVLFYMVLFILFMLVYLASCIIWRV